MICQKKKKRLKQLNWTYHPDNADKINFVIDRESPSIGATYQDILNRYPIIVEELRIEDSIRQAEWRLIEEKLRIDKLKRDKVLSE